MLGKLTLVKVLGWDLSGNILAGPGKVGRAPCKSPIPAQAGVAPRASQCHIPSSSYLQLPSGVTVTSQQPRRFLGNWGPVTFICP